MVDNYLNTKPPDPSTKRILGRFQKFSSRWVRCCAGLVASIHATLGLAGDLIAYYGNFLHPFTFSELVMGNLLLIIALAFGTWQVKNRLGNLVLAGAFMGSGYVLIFIAIRLSSFTLAQLFWFGVLIFEGFGIIFALARLRRSYSTGETRRLAIRRMFTTRHHGGLVFLLVFISLGTAYGAISFGAWQVEVPIQPQNYQIQFRMWATYDPSWYTGSSYGQAVLEQLNRHNVTIQNTLFTLRDADNRTESFAPSVNADDVAHCVNTLTWFRDNAPYVRFQYYAYGIGYASNGNYEGSLYSPAMVKRFVDVCRNYSLPNVVGIYTDWEGPGASAPAYANASRNGWHQALWTDAFAYVRTYFPNWTLSCCHMDSTHWDLADGDDDLQYFERYNIFNPMWDDYGPMVYRSCNREQVGTQSAGGSWMIYGQSQALLKGALRGDVTRASMWVGCTGCGPYQPDTIVYEHGAPIAFGDSKGFAALARDILILKHFGFPSVSIFLWNEVGDSPPGFFDSYGYADALDRLDDTVNGPNSTRPFTIWTDGTWNPAVNLMVDLQLNLNSFEYLPLIAGLMAMGGIVGFHDVLRDRFQRKIPR